VNCTVIRRSQTDSKVTQHLSIVSGTLFANNFTLDLEFLPNTTQSSPFSILHKEVLAYDTAQIKLTISSDFAPISRLEFHCTWADLSSVKFSCVSRCVMSILHVYMLTVSLSSFSIELACFHDFFCIVIGISGNPFPLFLGFSSFGDQLTELKILRSQKETAPFGSFFLWNLYNF
jgi:hypothetical protein